MALSSVRHLIVGLLVPLVGHSFLRTLGRCAYRRLRRRSFADPSPDRGAVVFAGDSLIDQWTALAENFPALKVANRGISGDVSLELLRRFRGDVLACHPRAVVILIGTNDLAGGTSPARIAARLRRILTLAASFEDGVPVIVCRLLPREKEPGRFPEKIRELNALIDRLPAGRKGVSICDTFTPLAAEDGGHRESCFIDGLHLSPAGYHALAAALAPHLAGY